LFLPNYWNSYAIFLSGFANFWIFLKTLNLQVIVFYPRQVHVFFQSYIYLFSGDWNIVSHTLKSLNICIWSVQNWSLNISILGNWSCPPHKVINWSKDLTFLRFVSCTNFGLTRAWLHSNGFRAKFLPNLSTIQLVFTTYNL
jgi:hypothetical protein